MKRHRQHEHLKVEALLKLCGMMLPGLVGLEMLLLLFYDLVKQ
jgi:hypothetical protein